ncbi:metallophosphoesterase family protein [Frigoriglobus tundricola]|uniref:Calcineurin-like phosphoesterase domain-containing protein n=1 Tax=Frigoriglobus tundricola TaxID=2774151 RepID=A0A6M5YTU1_9BACT|nr:metallophosphoesterase family protein [Frigoriglobus tundricola]QJW96743.1 hypothetical protein FTUN_4302 [Frigoriglobus tundricola]
MFGDLHGRILPAFRFAAYWTKRTGREVAALLQVGDLGYFPDVSRMDKATLRHAKGDPLELGALDVATRTSAADRVFDDDPHCPPGLWFTAGNHEDFDELERYAQASGRQSDFAVDAYCRVRGIKDGAVHAFDRGPRVAAVWGVDGGGPNARQNLPPRGYIAERAVDRLTTETFDVLLMHDAPEGAKRVGYGSELLHTLIELAQPRFAFFGHYHGDGSRIEQDYGRTEVYHLTGFELRTRDGHPERGSVGVLEWAAGDGTFAFVEDSDLKPFTRHNWKWV